MNRKVHLVRFWILCLAALCLVLAYPEWAIALPPLLFFPGQAGCFCCEADCTGCQAGTAPAQMQVDLPVLTDNSCTECIIYSGTWVLDEDTDHCFNVGSAGGICNWKYTDETLNAGCGGSDGVCISANSTDLTRAAFAYRAEGNPPSGVWGVTPGTGTPDCSAFSSLSLAWAVGGTPSATDCTGTGTTATMTSL